MGTRVRILLVVGVLAAVAAPGAAVAQEDVPDPDPADFTPSGYTFCGWKDMVNGGWATEWDDDLSGAYQVAYARGISCTAARRNVLRLKYSKRSPYKPSRKGYRCARIAEAHEFVDVRCTKRSNPKVAFRTQSGA